MRLKNFSQKLNDQIKHVIHHAYTKNITGYFYSLLISFQSEGRAGKSPKRGDARQGHNP
jgi:hypothetical protein